MFFILLETIKDEFMNNIFEWSPEIKSTAIISFFGLLWTITAFVLSNRQTKQKQNLEYLKVIRLYDEDLRLWANEVVNLMSKSGHLCDLDPSKDSNFFVKIHEYKIQMSALIDQGRFFLPNSGRDEYGQHKPSAYRGFSSDSISAIKNGYDLLFKLDWYDQDPNKILRSDFMTVKREFVSSIQDKLDPEKFEREFKKILIDKI